MQGYRTLIGGALVCVILISLGIGYMCGVSNHPEVERYPTYRYAPDDVEAATKALGNPSHPPEYRQPCTEPKGHDETDLCAQWKAARAAESSALWTERSFWAAGVGIVGLLATLWFNFQAWEIARYANQIAQETGIAQTRAYLHIDEVRIVIKMENHPVIRVKITNSGQSPATNVRYGCGLFFMESDGPHVDPVELDLSRDKFKFVEQPFLPIGGGTERWFEYHFSEYGLERPVNFVTIMMRPEVSYDTEFPNVPRQSQECIAGIGFTGFPGNAGGDYLANQFFAPT
jgi:hypothetical protein